MSKSGSHELFLLELSASRSWMTITSWGGAWSTKWATSWFGARPSEGECLVGGVVAFLFLLKTSPEVVSSSCSVGAWVIVIRSFIFWVKESLGMLVVALIFLAISASSALLIWVKILYAKKISKWLISSSRVIFTKSRKWGVPV